MSRHRALTLAAIAAATLVLGACGAEDAYNAAPAPPPPAAGGATGGYGAGTDAFGGGTSGAAATPDAAAPEAADAAVLEAQEAPELGTIVADAEGRTLYRFDDDSADPPTTTCVDACATQWPPYVVDREGTLSLEGVEQSAVGLVERPDGTTQLTLGGWPVYRFSGDTAPGATEGQGASGTWFAVTPDGKKASPTS